MLSKIIAKISSEVDLTSPGVAEALGALNGIMIKRNSETRTDEISFSA
jgi:hypothetical protein